MKTMTKIGLVAIGLVLLNVVAFASDVTIPNTFITDTTASAAQVNANFAAVEAAIDDNDARLDAMAAGGVTSAYITNGTIMGTDVGTDTLTAGNIAAGAIGTSEILDGSVASADILDGTIAAADIADAAVTGAKVATDTLTETNIKASAVGTSELASNAVTAAKILDEPGIKNATKASFTLAAGTANQNVHSLTVNYPATGYVLVLVSCYIYNNHAVITNSELIRTSIDTTPTGLGFLHNLGSYTAQVPVGTYYYGANLHRVFSVSGSGSTTYYFNAASYFSNTSTWIVYWIQMTALYFPTAY